MTAMFITYLFSSYATWLFASVMFIWLGSALYRTTRNTLNASCAESEGVGAPTPSVLRLPSLPGHAPTIHLAAA